MPLQKLNGGVIEKDTIPDLPENDFGDNGVVMNYTHVPTHDLSTLNLNLLG